MATAPLSLEVRKALVEASRLLVFLYYRAASDPVSFHAGSRDLQRHFLSAPEIVLEGSGIKFPDPLVGIGGEFYKNPAAYYQMIADYNGWTD